MLDMETDEDQPEIKKPLMDADLSKLDLRSCYKEFLSSLDEQSSVDLIVAANYLDIKKLTEIVAAKVASYIMVKDVKQCRQMLGIVNDWAPEEEERVIEENKWVQEHL